MDPWKLHRLQKQASNSECSTFAMYLELLGLLLYCKVADGEYNININQFFKYNIYEITRQGTYEVIVAKTRLRKSDENFWIITAIAYNIFVDQQI